MMKSAQSQSKKRVLFVDHATVTGGAQLILVNNLKYLDAKRFYKIVCCSDENSFLITLFKKHADKVYEIPFKRLKAKSINSLVRFFETVSQIRKIIRTEHVEVVCCNTERAVYTASLAALFTGAKVVWFIMDFRYNRLLLSFLSFIPKQIFYVSHAIKNYYALTPFLKKGEVMHVTSDMHKRIKWVLKNRLQKIKEDYGLKGKFVVGYIGRLAPWKGVSVLEEAFVKYLSYTKDVSLVVIGDTEGKKRIKDSRIVYTGFMSDAAYAFSLFDVFVHPAYEPEPYATSVVESMMAGVPVVATNIGGTPELVINNETGLLIEPKDPKQLADAVLRLKEDKPLRIKLVENAKAKTLAENDIRLSIQKIEQSLL